MLMFFFLAGILLSALLVGMAYEKPGFVKLVFLGFSLYQALYLFMSALLMLFSAFLVSRAAAFTDIVLLIACVCAYFARGRRFVKLRFVWKAYLPLFVILIVAGFFCARNTAGVFGTGQDQGLYQSRAFFYMADKTEELITFPEYEDCLNKWEKVSYLREIRDLSGYYLDEELLDEEEAISGILHGLGTFPALMALWGKLFGLRYIPLAMISCYLLSIGNLWLILRNLWSRHKLYAGAATLLYAASPIVLWTGQNALTEIALTMCLTAFFVLLSDKREGANQLLGIVFAAGMCAVHIMSTIFIPLIVILYVQAYLASGRKHFLAAMMASVVAYGLDFMMMKLRFTQYTDGNYLRIYWMTNGLVTAENIVAVVWVAVALCLVLGVVFWLRGDKLALRRVMIRAAQNEGGGMIGRITAIAAAVLTLIALIVQILHRMQNPEQIPHITLIGYIIMTAYIVVPLAVAACISRGRELFRDRRLFSAAFAFYYSVWMFCFLINPEIWQYFYFARYLAPFMFLPFVLAGWLLHKLPAPVLGVSCGVLLFLVCWPSRILYLSQDMTNTQYAILEDIISCIGEDDVVLINEQGYHCQRLYTLPIKALCGADVHFVWEEDVRNQAKEYDKMYESVYLLSMYVGKLMADPVGWKEIYRTDVHGSIYEDTELHALPYPQTWTDMDTELVLLINDRSYDAGEDDADVSEDADAMEYTDDSAEAVR